MITEKTLNKYKEYIGKTIGTLDVANVQGNGVERTLKRNIKTFFQRILDINTYILNVML